MRATVFTDGALGRQAGQFVWLAIDTEKASNASFRKKFPTEALPTFFVVDPVTEAPVLRWVGGATAGQIQKLLSDGARSVAKSGKGLENALADADRLFAAGKNQEAVVAYRDLLAKVPSSWSSWGRATESLVYALVKTGDSTSCVKTACQAWPVLKKTASAANLAAMGLDCALALKPDDPSRAAAVADFTRIAEEVVADRRTPIAPDDRSGVYNSLLEARGETGGDAAAKKVATEWAAFLEAEAAKAKTPEARAVFDSHRLGAYLVLETPEKAIPMLEQSEKDLPGDYNPPARLAAAYKAMGRLDEAMAASDRALEKAYGPRRVVVLRTRADILAAKGDAAGAKKTMEDALALAEAQPDGQRSERLIEALKKKLASMS
jgi:tetratricopeptide (TPR) repeat protein